MRYDQLFHYVIDKLRNGEGSKVKIPNGKVYAEYKVGIAPGYEINLVDGVMARVNEIGMVVIYPSIKTGRTDSLARSCILVDGFVHEGKQYTAYSYQVRPGNYDRKLHSWKGCPLKLDHVKIGRTPMRCAKKLGVSSEHTTIDLVIPRTNEASYPSTNSGIKLPWVIYDDEGKLVEGDAIAEKFGRRLRMTFNPKTSIIDNVVASRPRLVNNFIGESKSHADWYQSIADTMRSIKGMRGTKSLIKDTMMLAARAHKAALKFQSHVPSAEIHLLPMCNEQQARYDCRFSVTGGDCRFENSSLSFYSSNYGCNPSLYSSTTSGIHWLGEPEFGNGCMMPSVVLTWPMPAKEKAKYNKRQMNLSKYNTSSSVVMTIPPVGLSNLGHNKDVFTLCRNQWVYCDSKDYDDSLNGHYKAFDRNVAWVHGRSRNGPDPRAKVTPAATFQALSWPADTSCKYEFAYLFANDHSGSKEADLECLSMMIENLFDFTNNQERVAIEYHHPAKEDNPDKFPRALVPDDFLDGLTAEATLQSMPLC